ncbi:FAD-binding oxidoreductase [Peribacillus sp. TH16]|uniref:FAD-binding oxidoreductase n=1 Tax=Peribacillus sp. TH16 TaxID=2798482 RepID=UPI00191127EE|nr:FAD-binding oxidoreductase [Peribacillus sp. TH16]MBK5485573.1 FAD-binding oxidoreductase [Peribacillus sp. TH16]
MGAVINGDIKNDRKKYRTPPISGAILAQYFIFPSFSKLETDITADVLIVAEGISGITSAYLLAKQGVKATLIEAGEILNRTTGQTIAKITAHHGLIYDQLITDHGEEKARL